MSDKPMEPPASTSLPPPAPLQEHGPSTGSLAGGVGLAWAIIIVGEVAVMMAGNISAILVGVWLPPLVIVVWAVVLFRQGKSRAGKGMFLGLLSIIAVVLLLAAACFGLMTNFH